MYVVFLLRREEKVCLNKQLMLYSVSHLPTSDCNTLLNQVQHIQNSAETQHFHISF